MKSSTASPRNSSRSLSSDELGFSLTYERCVRARDNRDNLEKGRFRRRLRSDAVSNSRISWSGIRFISRNSGKINLPLPKRRGFTFHQFPNIERAELYHDYIL